MSLEHTVANYDSLVKQAKRIDTIDAFTGPLTTALYYSGSSSLQSLGLVISVAEVALLKTPFILSYIAKTKDYTSLLHWVPKEIVSNAFQAGGFLDIVPTYLMRVQYMKNK